MMSCVGNEKADISQNKGKATNVPKVPGAFGANPLPKPSPKK
jgi:hypothetical protein